MGAAEFIGDGLVGEASVPRLIFGEQNACAPVDQSSLRVIDR